MFRYRRFVDRVKAPRDRRGDANLFDNWYVHCPKCGGLLVLRIGSNGPEWVCLCAQPRPLVRGIQ